MVALRRLHALLLLAVGAALLLLLLAPARLSLLTPGTAPPASSAPAAPAAAPLAGNTSATVNATRPRPAPAAPDASSPAAPERGARAPVPETRELYVAGHPVPHTERCPDLGRGLAVLVLVSSAPAHRAQRDAVRYTWGHYASRRDVAVAFVVGRAPPHEAALAEEDALYGDIVRGAFLDSYSNLTLKSVSMLEWAARYCPRAPLVLKTDDDVFVNMRALLPWAKGKDPASLTLWGRVLAGAKPRRDPRAKYYLPPEQLAGAALPAFASGPAYALTAAAARALLAAALAPGARYVRLEDVYVTGVAAARAGVRRRHEARFHNRRPGPGACPSRRRLALHDLRPHEMLRLWKDVMDDRTKC